MSETSDVVTPTLKALRKLPYVWATRLHSGSARGGKQQLSPVGSPDLLAIVRGVPVFLEAKSETGKLRDSQTEQAMLLRAAGAVVHTVRSVAEAMDVVRRYL